MYIHRNNFQGRLYTPGGIDNNYNKGSPDAASCSHDWFEYARLRGTSLVWTSDWFADTRARQWSYLAARLRSAATLAGDGVDFGGYIIGRTSYGSANLVMKIVALAGSGAKTINIYTFGPEFLFKENSYSDRYDTYYFLTTAFDMIGASETVLLPGRRPVAEVAILYPRSSFMFDPVGVQDFTNSAVEKKTTTYHLDLYGWYQVIANVYNFQVDFLDEDALLETDVLSQYKLVIVCAPNVPKLGAEALLAYAAAGGNVVLSAAAAARDEYNEILSTWNSVLASLSPSSPGTTGNSIYGRPSTGAGTGAHGAFVNWGQHIDVDVMAGGASQTGSYDSNASAAVLEASHGAGRVVRYLWAPGYSWHHSGTASGGSAYIMAELQKALITRRVWTNITSCAQASGLERGVETALLESSAGAAVTVMNWCKDLGVVAIDLFLQVPVAPLSVSSAVCVLYCFATHTLLHH